MRSISLVLMTAALAGCSTTPQPWTRSAEAEAHLQRMIAGRAAGPPVSCLPEFRTDRMTVIDENAIAFESGGVVYVNNLNGPCYRLGSPAYALKTNRPGGTGLCRGEIAEIVDTSTGMSVGGCTFGDFIPYRRVG